MGNTPDQSYLLKEYEECFTQLRYYDDRQTEFLKYYYTLATAVIAAEYALFIKFGRGTNDFNIALIGLSFVAFIAGVLFYVAMLQNRAYYIRVARQLNALRGYLLTLDPGFKLNQMWTTTELSAYNKRSLQTVEILGVTLTSSIFGAAFIFGFSSELGITKPLMISLISYFIITLIQIWPGIRYLRSKNQKGQSNS